MKSDSLLLSTTHNLDNSCFILLQNLQCTITAFFNIVGAWSYGMKSCCCCEAVLHSPRGLTIQLRFSLRLGILFSLQTEKHYSVYTVNIHLFGMAIEQEMAELFLPTLSNSLKTALLQPILIYLS
jgi:hypothetical protein